MSHNTNLDSSNVTYSLVSCLYIVNAQQALMNLVNMEREALYLSSGIFDFTETALDLEKNSDFRSASNICSINPLFAIASSKTVRLAIEGNRTLSRTFTFLLSRFLFFSFHSSCFLMVDFFVIPPAVISCCILSSSSSKSNASTRIFDSTSSVR